MPLDAKDIDALLQRNFVLDFPKLTFSPQNLSLATTEGIYTGSGYASLNDKGYFEIKSYHPEPVSIKEVFAPLHWKAGEIIKESLYYRLRATDIQGIEWSADGILPDWSTGPGGSMVVAKAVKLVFRESRQSKGSKNYLRIIFATRIKFPPNTVVKTEKLVNEKTRKRSHTLSVAQISSNAIDFEIEEEGNSTVLSAVSGSVLFDEKVINCIIDTFSFITGTTERWSLLEIAQGETIETRVQATNVDATRSRVGPPIHGTVPNPDVWRLFDQFLSFGLNSSTDDRHPLGPLVHSVISSGKSALEVEALTLSTSIESLLKTQFAELLSENAATERNIEVASKQIESTLTLDANFRKRVLGALSAMKSPRAKDFLAKLEELKLIEPTFVKVYGELRNKSAHGIGVEWAEIQSYLNQCSTMLVLFYQLIFLRIRYTGSYTDYGTYEYPRKDFMGNLA